MGQDMASARLLLLFLGFSYLLSCAAVPATRSLQSVKENHSSFVKSSLAQEAVSDLITDSEEGHIEGRMDMASTVDYPGTGANNHHDPKTPGRA